LYNNKPKAKKNPLFVAENSLDAST